MNNPKNAATQKPKLRRFYKEVSLGEADGGWQLLLDGKPMRTPAREPLVLPTRQLAEAVAAEWARQAEYVELDDMCQMQFSCAAIDYTQGFRADVESEAAAYIGTDLLCYRAQEPQALVERQSLGWNPWLDWARERHGLHLALVPGIMPVAQSEATHAGVAAKVAALDAFSLTALWLMAKHTGSFVLALAVLEGALGADKAFALSRIEEDWQNEQWGTDAEAAAKRHAAAAEMAALGDFIFLLQ